jgi:hypothetical protein
MKLLRIVDNAGEFLGADGRFQAVDKITKEDLLRLVEATIHEEEVDYDQYDGANIKNQAHQVIYRSILNKLQDLRKRRQEFVDESARLYLEDYQRYREQP